MEKLTKKEINCETGEEIIIELTDEETKAYLAEVERIEFEKNQRETAENEKAAIREAVLEKLGLTAEEAAALLA